MIYAVMHYVVPVFSCRDPKQCEEGEPNIFEVCVSSHTLPIRDIAEEGAAQDAYKKGRLSETIENAWMSSMSQSPVSDAAQDCMDDGHFSHIMGCCT